MNILIALGIKALVCALEFISKITPSKWDDYIVKILKKLS